MLNKRRATQSFSFFAIFVDRNGNHSEVKGLLLLCCMLMFCSLDGRAGHLHAVIVSGGMNKLMNQERYWNDCAFLYRTLLYDYHFPKENITLLISDGGDPGDDQLRSDGGGFTSSNPDLDGDGERDMFLTATTESLSCTLASLSSQLTHDDHLFLFLIDHGGSDDKQNGSYLWLWGSEKLYDTELAEWLSQFNVGSMNIVAGQCYSGGFIDDLTEPGRIVTTACRGDELSWNCPDKPYDEFVYHWTCAVAGHDELGNPVDADTNADGHVTMDEAFSYASIHDRRDETPQYVSWPRELGGQWTFDRMLCLNEDGIDETVFAKTVQDSYNLMGQRVSPQAKGIIIQPHKTGMFYKLLKQRAAAPLPSRGGAGVGSVTFCHPNKY